MTFPIDIPGCRPAPSGSQRAGSLSGFTDLAADLDTNFANIRSWAQSCRGQLDTVVHTSGWFTPATNWALSAPGDNVENTARRIGRTTFVNLGLNYTGTITTNATGGLATPLLMGTISLVSLRPLLVTQIAFSGYRAVWFMANAEIGTDGTIKMTGMSVASNSLAVNPSFSVTTSWRST